MVLFLFITVFVLCFLVVSTLLLLRGWLQTHKHLQSIAFFHPEYDGLGGGERVLWCIVKALLANGVESSNCQQPPSPSANGIAEIVVYSSSSSKWSPRECLVHVQERFGIDLLPWLDDNSPQTPSDNTNKDQQKLRLKFVPLYTTQLINPHFYPRFTLVLQSLGSMIVAIEALIRYTPHIFIDTTGYSFTLGLASWLAGCRVSAYIHYPTISTDMIRKVKSRQSKFNNAALVAKSKLLSYLKLIYYRIFAWSYGLCGGFMDTCVVNSSWTYSHISNLMTISTPHQLKTSSSKPTSFFSLSLFLSRLHQFGDLWIQNFMNIHRLPLNRLSVVYPPCDIKAFAEQAKPSGSRVCRIVSLSQFRPEKNHQLQLEAMARLLQLYKSKSVPIPKELELVICGAVRHLDDQIILDQLKTRSLELGLGERVRFEVNLSFNRMKELLGSSKVGLHTMIDEHFGIALVEFLAAGLLVVAHNSAGPRMDILNVSPLGALLSTTAAATAAAPMIVKTGITDDANGSRSQLSTSRSDDDVDDIVMLETPRRMRTTSGEDDDCRAATFGYLCQTANGFAEALYQCLTGSEESLGMLSRSPASLKRFNNNDEFGRRCIKAMEIFRLLQN